MALFKYINGGVCEVLTEENILKLRKNTNYKEITEKNKENKKIEETKKEKQEFEESKKMEK